MAIFCKNCGQPIEENSAFCTSCGQPIETGNVGVNVPNTGNNANYPYRQPVQTNADKSNKGLNVLSYFVPIFGFIWYFVKRKERPREAKGTLKSAIAGFVINFVVIMLSVVLVMVTSMGLIFGNMTNTPPNTTEKGTTYYSEVITEPSENEKAPTTSAFGNTKKTEKPTKPSNNVSYQDYTVEIGGQKIKLPVELKEFEDITGFRVKDSEKNEYDLVLQPGEHKTVLEKNEQGTEVFLEVYNDSSSPKSLGYCSVGGVSQYANSGSPVTFASGIQVGQHMTKSDVVSAFGEPTDLTENGSYARLTYYEDFKTYGADRMFVVTLNDGIVTEIITQTLI